MSNSEVESISNGLERCTMLLKDILQPTATGHCIPVGKCRKGVLIPQRHVIRMQKPPQAVAKRIVQNQQRRLKSTVILGSAKSKKTPAAPNVNTRKTAHIRSAAVKEQSTNEVQKSSGCTDKRTKYDVTVPSSTPIRKEKLQGNERENWQQAEKGPTTITSSQASLIELLQEFNMTPIAEAPPAAPQQLTQAAPPAANPTPPPPPAVVVQPPAVNATLINQSQLDGANASATSLDRTLTPSRRALTPNGRTSSVLQNRGLQEALTSLRHTIEPYDAASGGVLGRAVDHTSDALHRAVRAAVAQQPCELPPCLQMKMTSLENENATLQRRLQEARSEIQTRGNKSLSEEISLEVSVLQCKNATLEKQVEELSKQLQLSTQSQEKTKADNAELQAEVEKLSNELTVKNDELARSGKIFTNETEQIRQEVDVAMSKLENLKRNLRESDAEKQALADECRNKDAEIGRLAELNKGLQSSVSRLLDDLRKSAQAKPAADHMSNFVLRQLDSLLSAPPLLSDRRPAPASPAHHHHRAPLGGGSTVEQQRPPAVAEFLSSPARHRPVVQTLRPSPPPATYACGLARFDDDVTTSSSPTPSTSLYSVTSSMTSHDERNFDAGLASLDANIQRLQASLKCARPTP